MERISETLARTVEHLRHTIDLLAIVERDTRLRKVGANWYAGPCPFCGGTDRFVLKHTSDGWRWLCRHCTNGKYFDVVDYIQRREGLDFKAAVRLLGGDLSSPLRDDDLPPLVQKPQTKPQQQDPQTIERLTALAFKAARLLLDRNSMLAEQVRAYLDRRGLNENTRDLAMLGAAMAYDKKVKRERPAVAIPYHNDALNVRAIKYRFVDDDPNGLRYTMEQGSAVGFYYIPEYLGRFDRLLVCEGELNALSIAQAKPEADLLSTGSQSIGEGMKQILIRLAGRYRRVYCWFDDPKRAAEMARLTRGVPIQSPVMDGVKWDANAMLQAGVLSDFLAKIEETSECVRKS